MCHSKYSTQRFNYFSKDSKEVLNVSLSISNLNLSSTYKDAKINKIILTCFLLRNIMCFL